MEYELPPRYSPDNSPEARQRRMAQHQFKEPKVTEIPSSRTHGAFAVDHALAWVKPPDNVVEVEFNPEPPEDICA